VALFIFGPRGRMSRLFHRQGQRPFHGQWPRPQFSEYLAAVVESDTAIRIRIDVAAPPILVIKSGEDYSQARERGMGPNFCFGKRTLRRIRPMSALPPKADIS
jgi:hypothetical protein